MKLVEEKKKYAYHHCNVFFKAKTPSVMRFCKMPICAKYTL